MEQAHKVTLSSKRVVLLRSMKIKYQTLASQAVGKRGGDNQLLLATLMQQELLKQLLISVDEYIPKASELEDLDQLFDFSEYNQLMRVVGKLAGGDEGECQTEIVNTGTP